jgi:tetratricopeptide (TPR) repeat protein
MKALEKDRSRRYETANALARDVQRYLADEVVEARPPSAGYRLRKFIRRHKGRVLAASLVLLALVAGIIGTSWGLVQERRATKQAQQDRDKAIQAEQAERTARQHEEEQRKYAEAIAAFVRDDFLALTSVEGQYRFGSGPEDAGLNKDTTLRQLLDRAAGKLSRRQDLEPRTEAELNWIVGVNYRAMGEAKRAVHYLERCVALRQQVLGRDDDLTLNALNSLGVAFHDAGQLDRALPVYQETLRLWKAKVGAEHPEALSSLSNLATGYRDAGQLDRALPLLEEVLRLTKAKVGPEQPETLAAMNNLGTGYLDLGQLDRALSLFEETLRLRKARLGPDHPHTLDSMNNLAAAHWKAGKLDSALPLVDEALRQLKARVGPDHPHTLMAMNNLAAGYQKAGQLDRALPLLEEALSLMKAKLGPEHPETLLAMNNLAATYLSARRLDRSGPLFEEALKLKERRLGRNHPDTLITVGNLGVSHKDAGRLTDALPLLEEVHRASRTLPTLREFDAQLLDGYAQAGRSAEVAALTKELLADARKSLPKDSPQLAGTLAQYGSVLLQAKAFADAEPTLRECLAIREKTEPDAWTTFNTRSLLGGALLGQRKYAEAEPMLRQGYEGMKAREKTIPQAAATRIPQALDRLIELYTATNKPDEVAKWRAERARYDRDTAPKPAERKSGKT